MELPKNLAARYSVMSSEDTAQGMMGSKGAAALIENLPASALKGGRPGYITADQIGKEERLRPGALSWGKYGPSFHLSSKEITADAKKLSTEDLYAALGRKHAIDVNPPSQGGESAAVKAEVKAELVRLDTPAPSAAAEKAAEKAAEQVDVAKAEEGKLSGLLGDFTMPELSMRNIICGLVVLSVGVAAGVAASRKGLI